MDRLKPGETAKPNGYYLADGYSIFLRQGQKAPMISSNVDPGLGEELEISLLKDLDEQG